MILSGNAIDHALLMSRYTPASRSRRSGRYSAASRTTPSQADLRSARPGLVYVPTPRVRACAGGALDLAGVELAASRNGAISSASRLSINWGRAAGRDSARSAQRSDPTRSRIHVHSGSTGAPKGVINTHGMLTANSSRSPDLAFLTEQPPCWSMAAVDHTFGGNHNSIVLRLAGTLTIDGAGRADLSATVRNLSEFSPTVYFKVPAGTRRCSPVSAADAAFAALLRQLRFIFYAGADCRAIWTRLEEVSVRITGEPFPHLVRAPRDGAARDRRAFFDRPRRTDRRAAAGVG